MARKTLRIILISCVLITSFLLSGTACAQDEELPDPGITPDSPFYFFDTFGKKIGMFFTFGDEAKARKALQYAEERLAEARKMANKTRIIEMTRAANDYDGFMAMVNERAEEARRQGVSDNISERVALATSKHLSVLDMIKDKFPDQAEEVIARARTASMNGQKNALRALARAKPERALEINSEIIEKRLNRARIKATENITAEVEEALEYAERLAELEEELSDIARRRGTDNISVAQRIAHATTNRIEVLAEVYEKVPEQAKAAIARAVDNSIRKYDRAIGNISENNKPAQTTEAVQALHRMREELKERLILITSSEEVVQDNASLQNQNRMEIQESVQKKVREQIKNLEQPATESAPVVSANKTSENKKTATENVKQKRSP